jgi:hypothetical protein
VDEKAQNALFSQKLIEGDTMLTFLRKHQRILFMVVATVTIASFLFLGTATNLVSEEKVVDKEMTKAIDGSSLMERDVQSMIRFFSCANIDFIQTDFFSTGLGVIVAETYFDQLKGEVGERLEKAKHYRPYAHPQAPFINVEEVWHRFAPEVISHISSLKESPLSPQSFALLSRLYLDQTVVSPALLEKILLYQQKQYEWIRQDPSLSEERLALFGFHSLEDWFGPKYLEKVALIVMNAAKIAQGKGYTIAKEEVKTDLLQHTRDFLKAKTHKDQITEKEAQDFLRYQLRLRQIDETASLKIWKNIMLFRRLFDEVGQGMFLDNLLYHQFADYAGEAVTIERYQLPAFLRFQNFRDFLKFQYYIEAVAPKVKTHLAKLPLQFYEVEELEKRSPELVYSQFYLEVSKVKRSDIVQRITLKETWDWEISEGGWALLVKEFPSLKNTQLEERLKVLDALDGQTRVKIDTFARNQIANEHPEWIQEALQKTDPEKINVNISSKGAIYPFEDIESGSTLVDLLQGVAVGEKASFYSPGKESYYVVTVLEKPSKKEIMTFEESLKGDLIGTLLDKKLEDAYPDVRKKDPALFQISNGSWKAFKNVYDEVGALVYQAIPHEKNRFSEYASSRLAAFMEEARKSVIKEGLSSPYLTAQGNPLQDQWLLLKCDQSVKRSDRTTFSKEKIFEIPAGEWSPVIPSSQGDVTFFRLIQKTQAPDSIKEQITEGQKILSMDARRLLMRQVLARMEESHD